MQNVQFLHCLLRMYTGIHVCTETDMFKQRVTVKSGATCHRGGT